MILQHKTLNQRGALILKNHIKRMIIDNLINCQWLQSVDTESCSFTSERGFRRWIKGPNAGPGEGFVHRFHLENRDFQETNFNNSIINLWLNS